ncbi:MAG: 3-phosphoshikimate 1-carboxyvinyltransferase [Promethearchaeota archaeon]
MNDVEQNSVVNIRKIKKLEQKKRIKKINQIDQINRINHSTCISIPGSKSISHRVLILAALAKGISKIHNRSQCEDVKLTINALKQLGVDIWEENGETYLNGCQGIFPSPPEEIYLGNSGTGYRFFMTISVLLDQPITLQCAKGMKFRPVRELSQVLSQKGVKVDFIEDDGYPPVKIHGRLRGGEITISIEESSQYFSSLLLIAPLLEEGLIIHSAGIHHSVPYIKMTLELMQKFGASINSEMQNGIITAQIPFQGPYLSQNITVEGDYSAASFFFVAAAICGGSIVINGITSNSIQGDRYIIDCLQKMGCKFEFDNDKIKIFPATENNNINNNNESNNYRSLQSIAVDLGNYPDLVIPLAIAALFADGTSSFTNIGHLKFKESNRLDLLNRYLTNLGAKVILSDSFLIIEPQESYHGILVDPQNDHRIAMGFSIAGLRIDGMEIQDPDCVKKSFPNFFELLDSLYT